MKVLLRMVGLLALTVPAMAAGSDRSGMNMPGMSGMSGKAMGTHDMPGIVTDVDQATGLIDVTSEGVKMRLHFPPASLKGLRSGDKVVLHLGFTKL